MISVVLYLDSNVVLSMPQQSVFFTQIAKMARDQEAGSNFLIDPSKQDQAQQLLNYKLPSPQARRHILSLGMKAESGNHAQFIGSFLSRCNSEQWLI